MSLPSKNIEYQEHWIVVVELDDVVQRRDPLKPNLYLGLTVTPPPTRFNQIKSSKRKTWYLGSVQKLREDLIPAHAFPDRQKAVDALTILRVKLTEEGYTVNRYTIVWHVYVLELDSSEIKDRGEGYVYVGETSAALEIRLKQHRRELLSKKGKPLWAKSIQVPIIGYSLGLAPKETYYSEAQAKRAEAESAQALRDRNYLVLGGH